MTRIWRRILPLAAIAAVFAAATLLHAQPAGQEPREPQGDTADKTQDQATQGPENEMPADRPGQDGAGRDTATEGTATDGPSGQDAPAQNALPDSDVILPMEKRAELAPREMLARSDQLIVEMKRMLDRVIAIQQVARKQKDVIRLNCVNDRLIQVKKLLNIAEAARTELVEAIAGNDDRDRYHQFSKVTIAYENISVLRDEAEACVGEELMFVGPTRRDVEKPPILDDPTLEEPFDYTTGDELQRPEFATPMR
ncbi:MAG: hypothetical protein MJE77_23575 [Proteobacteria bacterium]|nr:hypothetical protein [Pseudomonadota bacterium]